MAIYLVNIELYHQDIVTYIYTNITTYFLVFHRLREEITLGSLVHVFSYSATIPTLVPGGIQLGDLLRQLVDAVLQGVGPPRQPHGLAVQLPEDVLGMLAQVAELADDAGQRVVGHALELVADVAADVDARHQDGLHLSLDQRHGDWFIWRHQELRGPGEKAGQSEEKLEFISL